MKSNIPIDEDRILINEVKKGAALAQRKLYEKYYRLGMKICLRYSSDIESAKEILNDGYVKVFRSINRFESNRKFEPWFSKIITNTAIDYCRRKIGEMLYVESSEQIEIEATVIDEMNANDLLRCIQDLSNPYRLVFNLYEIEGFNHTEISNRLGITPSSSRSILSRAKRMLKQKINVFTKENKENWLIAD